MRKFFLKKTDILRVSRNLKQNNDAILIHGFSIFYVNALKEVVGVTKKFCELRDMDHGKSGSSYYWDLAEENRFIEIAKKSVSGTLNQNLIVYDIPENDFVNDMQKVISSRLDGNIAESFANYIAKNLTYVGCYAIQITVCELSETSKDSRGYKTTDDDLCETDVLTLRTTKSWDSCYLPSVLADQSISGRS